MKLKHCPFCGNEHVTMTKRYGNIYRISCPDCQTYFGYDCTAGKDEDEAETAKRWNKRAEL